MKALLGFAMGLLFGVGLVLGGMTSPDKVLGFLDIAGAWDPSLAFVMGGAVLAAMPLFALARRRRMSLTGSPLDEPPTTLIDRRLLTGAVLFGLGWGLAGICPGPALVNLAIVPVKGAVFVVAMLAGLFVSSRLLPGRRADSLPR